MKKKQYSFDSKCYDLAESFAEDESLLPDQREVILNELAQRIQDTIEDFFRFEVNLKGKFKVMKLEDDNG